MRTFETTLRTNGRSPALTRMVLSSLGALVGDAQERGLALRNPVRGLPRQRRKAPGRHKAKLVIGVDIPTPAEIRALLNAAQGGWHAFFSVAALAGLRGSELRGLRWPDIALGAATITVRQRADAWGKSAASSPKQATARSPCPRWS